MMKPEERERMMEFILQQQARFQVDIEKANQRMDRLDASLARTERILKLAIRAGDRRFRQQREEMKELTGNVNLLALVVQEYFRRQNGSSPR